MNEATEKTYLQIKNEMEKQRERKHWSKKDLEMIIKAQKTGDWSDVHKSKLYNNYSGEYCSLLEVLNGVERVIYS